LSVNEVETVRVGNAGFIDFSSCRNDSACCRFDSRFAFFAGSASFWMSAFSLSISPGIAAICFSMYGTPPTPASGLVRFSFVRSEAMISSLGLVAAYDSLPCQWSQWKLVLMTLMTGFLVMPWICWYMDREAEGFECESTTTTPSSVRITAALQLTL